MGNRVAVNISAAAAVSGKALLRFWQLSNIYLSKMMTLGVEVMM